MSQYASQPPLQTTYHSQPPQQAAPSYYQQESKPQQYGQSNTISSENKINQNPKYNDLWASILFMLCLISFAVLAYFGINDIRDYLKTDGSPGTEAIARVLGISFAISIGAVGLVALFLSFLRL